MNDLESTHLLDASVSVRLAWPFVRAIECRPLPERAKAPLDESFSDPELRLSPGAVLEKLGQVGLPAADPTLGLRAGRELDGADLGPIERAARCAESVRHSIEVVIRHVRVLHAAGRSALLIDGDRASWQFWIAGGARSLPWASDFAVAGAVGFLRRHAPGFRAPLEVHLRHASTSYAGLYESYLGVTPRFDAPRDSVVFPTALLTERPAFAAPTLFQAFERQLARASSHLDARIMATRHVREVVSEQLQNGEVSMQRTAKELGTSVPTLRRRLREEGTNFRTVVENLRTELAREHLAEHRASVGEVAGLLGFSDLGAFGRAFKRWSGVTPTQYRSRAM